MVGSLSAVRARGARRTESWVAIVALSVALCACGNADRNLLDATVDQRPSIDALADTLSSIDALADRRPSIDTFTLAPCDAASTLADGGPVLPPAYLTTRPSPVAAHVIDLASEPAARTLLARSLQGVINRTAGEVYLIDDQDAEDNATPLARQAHEHWLSEYQARGLITIARRESLDQALMEFAHDFDGYFLVSETEYWTLNAAVTAGIGRRALIATSTTAPALVALGLPMLQSFVGRWPDASACYLELAGRVGQFPAPGFAILASHFSRLHDFLLQQGVLTLGGYEAMPEWVGARRALTLVPPQATIYGYPAQTAEEEFTSVNEISAAGDVLVASDSTPNVSFHVAVMPPAPTLPVITRSVIDCASAELNVVVALSDGDNLVVPLMLYPNASYWLAPQRGMLPIVWSISPALATIAPAAFAYYARTLAPGDELVSMIGPGYAYGGTAADPNWFYDEAFNQLSALGLRTLWLFDPGNEGSRHYTWLGPAEQAVGCGVTTGLLDGYYPAFFVHTPNDETVGTVPVMRARGQYSDGPADIATRIRGLLAAPRAQRPPVAFYSAAAWSNDIPTLVAQLLPLQAQGVRFLNATTAMQCVTR